MACATLKRSLDWESMSQLPAKRRRCPVSPYAASSSTSPKVEPRASAFEEAISGSMKMTLERLPQQLRDEIKRLQRRRQLRVERGAVCSSSSGSEGDCSPPHHSSAADPRHQPLFTFKQVRVICEKMLSEQERALRAEYESVLSNKLAEQYEAFVRFNLDQVQRRPPPATCMALGMDAEHMHQDLVPSYLS